MIINIKDKVIYYSAIMCYFLVTNLSLSSLYFYFENEILTPVAMFLLTLIGLCLFIFLMNFKLKYSMFLLFLSMIFTFLIYDYTSHYLSKYNYDFINKKISTQKNYNKNNEYIVFLNDMSLNNPKNIKKYIAKDGVNLANNFRELGTKDKVLLTLILKINTEDEILKEKISKMKEDQFFSVSEFDSIKKYLIENEDNNSDLKSVALVFNN